MRNSGGEEKASFLGAIARTFQGVSGGYPILCMQEVGLRKWDDYQGDNNYIWVKATGGMAAVADQRILRTVFSSRR